MTTDLTIDLTIVHDRWSVLIYAGTPGPDSLVASHTEGKPSSDPWGTSLPAGDWCRDDFELIPAIEDIELNPAIEAWPGTLIRRRQT
jgi:hypothetical protein